MKNLPRQKGIKKWKLSFKLYINGKIHVSNTLSWSDFMFWIIVLISNYEKHCKLQFYSILHQMEESFEYPNINVQCIACPYNNIFFFIAGDYPPWRVHYRSSEGQWTAPCLQCGELRNNSESLPYLYSYHIDIYIWKLWFVKFTKN